jgi:DNA-binding Xre family transcriptional regulator
MIFNHLPGIMAEKGVSIRRLSQLTNITYTTIRAIYHSERRSVQLEVLGAICQALDIQPGDIYTSADQIAEKPDSSPQVIEPAEMTGPEQPPKETEPEPGPPNNDWKNW